MCVFTLCCGLVEYSCQEAEGAFNKSVVLGHYLTLFELVLPGVLQMNCKFEPLLELVILFSFLCEVQAQFIPS